MKKTGYDMLYLTACAINGVTPDKNKTDNIDMDKLFSMCESHSLTGAVCTALEMSKISDRRFSESKSKAIRKVILLDAERDKIFAYMEENGIWHMPLKGVILKEMYPKIGMRQMADNDILFDENYRRELYNYMKSGGYEVEMYGKYNHDVYLKPPVYNFEMHVSLIGDIYEVVYNYFKDIKSRLIKDEGKNYAYHMSDEDFYIFLTAHEYKHYSSCGTGLRSLLDRYVYLRAKGDSLDWDYIHKQLKIIGEDDYECKARSLANKIFGGTELPTLSVDETKMLEYYLFSGTYGTVENSVKNKINVENQSKFEYVFHRIFPPMSMIKSFYPFFYKYKILLPFLWIYRIFKGIFLSRAKVRAEIRTIRKL